MDRRKFLLALLACTALVRVTPARAGVSSVGAIYATASKLLQRIYIPSVSDAEIAQQFVAAGETLLNVPLATYQQGGIAAVQALVGTPTFSGRCAVVDGTNKVIDHIIADPLLYTDPRGQVIPHDHTIIGDAWNGSAFTRLFVELDHTTGLVVKSAVQPINTAAPQVNALNWLVIGSVAPTALPGQSVPLLTAKIVAVANALGVSNAVKL